MTEKRRIVEETLEPCALVSAAATSDSDSKLSYDKPATKWTEALPVGNGRIGAMLFGGTENAAVQINQSTLSGGRSE